MDSTLILTASLYDIPPHDGLGAMIVTRAFMLLISLYGALLYLGEGSGRGPWRS